MNLKNLFKEKLTEQEFIQEPYSIKRGHRILFDQVLPRVNWDNIVWEKLSIPRHRIVFWLVMLEKLKTKERLGNMGVVTDLKCLLCTEETETIPHLFFECRYSRECLEEIKRWLGLNSKATRLDKLLRWIKKSKQTAIQKRVSYAIICALVYQVWKVRNGVLWESKLYTKENTVQKIKGDMRLRLKVVKPQKISNHMNEWFESICGQKN